MNRIITVGREFGSGGREIGRKIAQELGIAYYDHEIVTELIRRTNLAEEYIRSIEEKNPVPVFAVTTGRTFLSISNPLADQQVSILSEEGRIIQDMAEKSDCVIVGRRADYILRDKKPLRLFIYAGMDLRCSAAGNGSILVRRLLIKPSAKRFKALIKNAPNTTSL